MLCSQNKNILYIKNIFIPKILTSNFVSQTTFSDNSIQDNLICKTKLIKLLIEKGVDINIPNSNGLTLINMACYKGHTKIVKLLIENGADINIPNNKGYIPINSACHEGHIEIIKLLNENNANAKK